MPNPKKQAGDNQPAFIGPKNDKYPDKNWTIGAKIGDTWYNQAAFESTDIQTGEPNGGLTVILTPAEGASKSAPQRGGYQQKSFGNKQNYRY